MRTRRLTPAIAIALLAGVPVVVRAVIDAASSTPSADRTSPSLEEPAAQEGGTSAQLLAQTVTAGSVQILIEPVRIDDDGARFRIVMDTHSEDLSVDLASASALQVDGVMWTSASWSGSPPGGHHREGELAFDANGPAVGAVTLSVGGFPDPVEVNWTLGT